MGSRSPTLSYCLALAISLVGCGQSSEIIATGGGDSNSEIRSDGDADNGDDGGNDPDTTYSRAYLNGSWVAPDDPSHDAVSAEALFTRSGTVWTGSINLVTPYWFVMANDVQVASTLIYSDPNYLTFRFDVYVSDYMDNAWPEQLQLELTLFPSSDPGVVPDRISYRLVRTTPISTVTPPDWYNVFMAANLESGSELTLE